MQRVDTYSKVLSYLQNAKDKSARTREEVASKAKNPENGRAFYYNFPDYVLYGFTAEGNTYNITRGNALCVIAGYEPDAGDVLVRLVKSDSSRSRDTDLDESHWIRARFLVPQSSVPPERFPKEEIKTAPATKPFAVSPKVGESIRETIGRSLYERMVRREDVLGALTTKGGEEMESAFWLRPHFNLYTFDAVPGDKYAIPVNGKLAVLRSYAVGGVRCTVYIVRDEHGEWFSPPSRWHILEVDLADLVRVDPAEHQIDVSGLGDE